MTWRRFDWFLLGSMIALWAAATARSLIGSTTFIGHVSMLALVLAALATLRSDSPTEPTNGRSGRRHDNEET